MTTCSERAALLNALQPTRLMENPELLKSQNLNKTSSAPPPPAAAKVVFQEQKGSCRNPPARQDTGYYNICFETMVL